MILHEKTKFLNEKKAQLEASTLRLKQLKAATKEKMDLKEELSRKINECIIKLERASKLTTLLKDEKSRWSDEIAKINAEMALVDNDSLLIAGLIAYSGPFVISFRQQLRTVFLKQLEKQQLHLSRDLDLISFLGNPLDMLNWSIKGLPNDETSIENGIIIFNSKRFPLMIDPQRRANRFLKNMAKDLPLGIAVIKAQAPTLLRQIEQSIQVGKWVLVENLGLSIDPALEPLLSLGQIQDQENGIINLGDRPIPYNANFNFFMTTNLPNPHYSPEISAKVTIINFGIT